MFKRIVVIAIQSVAVLRVFSAEGIQVDRILVVELHNLQFRWSDFRTIKAQ